MSPAVSTLDLELWLAALRAHDARHWCTALREQIHRLSLGLEQSLILEAVGDLEDEGRLPVSFDEEVLIAFARQLARPALMAVARRGESLSVIDAEVGNLAGPHEASVRSQIGRHLVIGGRWSLAVNCGVGTIQATDHPLLPIATPPSTQSSDPGRRRGARASRRRAARWRG